MSDTQLWTPSNSYEAIFYADGYFPEWQMSSAECCALIMLLDKIRPKCAIEIGTAGGGSLSVLSKFSEKVYSFDIDTTLIERLGSKFPNVELTIGRSQKTLPPILEQLANCGASLEFVLIDGSHSYAGTKQDIENVLKFQPSTPLYILIHDSFNPVVRRAILDANWSSNRHVHWVNVDFIQGILSSNPRFQGEMWGGFALALLLPNPIEQPPVIDCEQELMFQTLLSDSAHRKPIHRLATAFHRLTQKIFNN
ncbi:class I SAM-dependent methyltransferase [Coleofasciculus sp.]|uniref:class I SAM-dependent methyltransferase n=1 Tax=Coleofasciculus sp. TaxID=3100458 RepID=UPI0039FA7D82